MDFNIDTTYEFIQSELQKGHRGLVSLKSSQIDFILGHFASLPLKKTLFVLSHTSHPTIKFAPLISGVMKHESDEGIILFALSAFSNHVIKAYQKEGIKIPVDYLVLLKTTLVHPSSDIQEWTLRLIEECGQQGIIFRDDLNKIKPPPWKLIFQTQRNIRELIEFLERRWRL